MWYIKINCMCNHDVALAYIERLYVWRLSTNNIYMTIVYHVKINGVSFKHALHIRHDKFMLTRVITRVTDLSDCYLNLLASP